MKFLHISLFSFLLAISHCSSSQSLSQEPASSSVPVSYFVIGGIIAIIVLSFGGYFAVHHPSNDDLTVHDRRSNDDRRPQKPNVGNNNWISSTDLTPSSRFNGDPIKSVFL